MFITRLSRHTLTTIWYIMNVTFPLMITGMFALQSRAGIDKFPVIPLLILSPAVAVWLYQLVAAKRRGVASVVYAASILSSLVILASVYLWALSALEPAGCATIPGAAHSCNFSEPLSKIDSVYFVLTTISTTGYGDIHPISQSARLFVSSLFVVFFLFVVVGLGIVMNRRVAGIDS